MARAFIPAGGKRTECPGPPQEQGVPETGQLPERIAADLGMEWAADLPGMRIPPEALALVPRAFAAKHGLIPIARSGVNLRVAVSDPLDTDGLDALGHMVTLPIEPVIAHAADVAAAIDRCYGSDAAPGGELGASLAALEISGNVSAATAPEQGATAATAGDAPMIKLVHRIILEAISRDASDIHLEPLESRFRVRYRIDGVLLEVESPPKRLHRAIISRLKIMANINIAEKRIPQDGRIRMEVPGRPIDIRVSSLPTIHGESVVMRILNQDALNLGLSELGLFPDDAASFERLVTLPDGILLVTGPTGSGKTTTLYGCLQHINKTDRKIITVEDPVEYQLSGINQVPVRHEFGMTFASALRAMLRQAPNIIMVGEIRDFETAEIALHASLTGHMVFSTLHTNDAAGAITRLVDLGAKPFLLASALRAVMAQRLVRKICIVCGRPCPPGPGELRALNMRADQAAGAKFARGEGCAECNGTGYRGRMGIFELFLMNDELQRMVHENAATSMLRQKARSSGMRTLREDGIRKATAGLTTIAEVVSLTVGDAS